MAVLLSSLQFFGAWCLTGSGTAGRRANAVRTICPNMSSSIKREAANENVRPPMITRPCSIASMIASVALALRRGTRRAESRRLKGMTLIAEIKRSACLGTRGCVGIETANDERPTANEKSRHQIFADDGNQ